MKKVNLVGAITILILLAGCIYEAPLNSKPTRPVDPQFAGDWRGVDDRSNKIFIRVFDKKQYAVTTVDGKSVNCYRVFSSDLDGLRLANVQDLAPGNADNGKWAFFDYRLDAKGRLVIRMINNKVILPDLKTTGQLRKAIKENRKNPALFLEELVYVKVAPAKS